MLNRVLAAVTLLVLVVVGSGCGKAAMDSSAPAGMAAPEAAYSEEAGLDEAIAMDQAAGAPEAKMMDSGGGGLFGKRDDARLAQAAPPPPPAPAATAAPPVGADPSAPPVEAAPSRPDAQLAGPLLIYTANLGLNVFEKAKSIDAVEKLARDAGGYLVVRNDETITIRVPAGQFDGTLRAVMKLGDVVERNVEVRDVTEEYYDLQTRLANKEAVLERLKELLAKASSVEDALKVEAELARVATEVEQMKGRLKLFRELISYSTITVRFTAQALEHVESRVNLPFPWLGGLGLSNLLSL